MNIRKNDVKKMILVFLMLFFYCFLIKIIGYSLESGCNFCRKYFTVIRLPESFLFKESIFVSISVYRLVTIKSLF